MLLPVKTFKSFISDNNLFNDQDEILLGVSGGKDSVAMVHLFVASGYKFGIAHCNFNLRGSESTRDQDFVQKLAFDLNVNFHHQQFDTDAYAKSHKISIQMAARDLRYRFFEEIRVAHGYQKIAVAHHQNDAIETSLLNLVRGTGIAGLHGIKKHRENLIRPMLCFNTAQIEEMVEENDIAFVEDSSNASNKYMRNKIRLDVLPELKKLNPSLEETFRKSMIYFNELEEFILHSIEAIRTKLFSYQNDEILIDKSVLKELHPTKFILFELLKDYHFNLTTVQNIVDGLLDGLSGKVFESDSHQIINDRTHLILSPKQHHVLREKQLDADEDEIEFGSFKLLVSQAHMIPKNLDMGLNKIAVDTELLKFPLKIRTWQIGDRFKPFGMDGEKKISDFFIEQKISLIQKKQIPVLFNGNHEVIWVAGLRADDRYKVTTNTKNLTIFELKKI